MRLNEIERSIRSLRSTHLRILLPVSHYRSLRRLVLGHQSCPLVRAPLQPWVGRRARSREVSLIECKSRIPEGRLRELISQFMKSGNHAAELGRSWHHLRHHGRENVLVNLRRPLHLAGHRADCEKRIGTGNKCQKYCWMTELKLPKSP